MKLKEKILWILAFIWTNIIPLLLVVGFCIGVFFNLAYVQNLSTLLSLIITIVGGFGLIFGFGKLLKKW